MSVVKSGFSDGVGNVNVKIFVGKNFKMAGSCQKLENDYPKCQKIRNFFQFSQKLGKEYLDTREIS